jgi:hypothetical protein
VELELSVLCVQLSDCSFEVCGLLFERCDIRAGLFYARCWAEVFTIFVEAVEECLVYRV